MKKFVIVSVILLIFLVASIVITRHLPDSSSQVPLSDSVSSTSKQYLSLNGELKISIPTEYQVSTQYGIRGKKLTYTENSTLQEIFIATSSKNLITIRSVQDPGNDNFSQVEAVNLLFDAFQKSPSIAESQKVNWSLFDKNYFGKNYYIYRDGYFNETPEHPVNVRQYITYYNNRAYFIEFENYLPNPPEPGPWDEIVSSIVFK